MGQGERRITMFGAEAVYQTFRVCQTLKVYVVQVLALALVVALLAGCVGGALIAGIPGWLKAKVGAHEVITTIMINYIAISFTNWLVTGPMQDPNTIVPQTKKVLPSATLPSIFADYRAHWGSVLALLVAVLVFWLLWKTVLGFEIRTVGTNESAAQYAGINVSRNIVVTMLLSGALAGAAGAIDVIGLNRYFAPGFSIGYGFDSIAVAVLGKNHPLGVILAAFLFGFAVRRAPPAAGLAALLVSAPLYGLLQWQFNDIHFLIRMALTFAVVTVLMIGITLARPLAEPRSMPVKRDFDMTSSPLVMWCGGAVIAAVIAFFVIFW